MQSAPRVVKRQLKAFAFPVDLFYITIISIFALLALGSFLSGCTDEDLRSRHLEWEAPTERETGHWAEPEEIGGYSILLCREGSEESCTTTILTDPYVTTHIIKLDQRGVYTLSIQAYDTDGLMGHPTEEIKTEL